MVLALVRQKKKVLLVETLTFTPFPVARFLCELVFHPPLYEKVFGP